MVFECLFLTIGAYVSVLTLLWGVTIVTIVQYPFKTYLRISSLENIEEMCPRYYTYSDINITLESAITQQRATYHKQNVKAFPCHYLLLHTAIKKKKILLKIVLSKILKKCKYTLLLFLLVCLLENLNYINFNFLLIIDI